jgi:predicted dienelactone hydrolase
MIARLLLALVLLLGGRVHGEEPADPAQPGIWPVGYRQLSFTDESRDLVYGGRTLPVHIWYPATEVADAPPAFYLSGGFLQLPALFARSEPPVAADKRWPLIIFSHGSDGTPTQSTPLMETLASHGYVVAAINHIGNSQTETPVVKDIDQAAADRVPDVSFVIDQLLALAQDADSDWFRALHPFLIGITGHSFGGTTSMGTAVGEFGVLAADPRVKAILPVSGNMEYFSDEALAQVPVPLLLLGGTADTAVPIANNSRAFELNQAAQPVWQVDMLGASHTHFANICAIADGLFALGIQVEAWPDIGAEQLIQPWLDTCSPEAFAIAEAQRLQNLYSVAFFKLHLEQDTRYLRYLRPDYSQQNETAINLRRKASFPWLARFKVW